MKKILLGLLVISAIAIGYFFIGSAEQGSIKWGINFSQKHTQSLGLDWKETYLALLDDLKTRSIKISAHWDLIEPKQKEYSFDDLDWQISEAKKRNAEVILVMGIKTPRWPECHIPSWAQNMNKDSQQKEVLDMMQNVVLRYKDEKAISAWQIENEPFFRFGDCLWSDKFFLNKEIALVKSNSDKPIIISDTGEMSLWFEAAEAGDIVGITMYRKVWSSDLKMYIDFLYPPLFYWFKAQLIDILYHKKVACVELQAEPWGPTLLYDSPVEEQNKTMDLNQFNKNIKFAKKTGLDEFYLWGAEWWYWMKTKQDNPDIWNQAKLLFE